jgi:hypothetical protein
MRSSVYCFSQELFSLLNFIVFFDLGWGWFFRLTLRDWGLSYGIRIWSKIGLNFLSFEDKFLSWLSFLFVSIFLSLSLITILLSFSLNIFAAR